MSKQDRQGVRTASELEQKIAIDKRLADQEASIDRRFSDQEAGLEKRFTEIMGVATDAQFLLEQTKKEIDAELSLKVGKDENDQVVSMLNASANTVNIKGNRLSIESTNFTLSEDGTLKAKNGEFTGKIKSSEGTIGEWILGQATIPLEQTWDADKQEWNVTSSVKEYALMSGDIPLTDSTDYPRYMKVYLTAKGVYLVEWYGWYSSGLDGVLKLILESNTRRRSWLALVTADNTGWDNASMYDDYIFGG